jgi:hypothetical protein
MMIVALQIVFQILVVSSAVLLLPVFATMTDLSSYYAIPSYQLGTEDLSNVGLNTESMFRTTTGVEDSLSVPHNISLMFVLNSNDIEIKAPFERPLSYNLRDIFILIPSWQLPNIGSNLTGDVYFAQLGLEIPLSSDLVDGNPFVGLVFQARKRDDVFAPNDNNLVELLAEEWVSALSQERTVWSSIFCQFSHHDSSYCLKFKQSTILLSQFRDKKIAENDTTVDTVNMQNLQRMLTRKRDLQWLYQDQEIPELESVNCTLITWKRVFWYSLHGKPADFCTLQQLRAMERDGGNREP